MLNVVVLDIVIGIILLLGVFYGTKKGFINGFLSLIGFALILTFSFLFHSSVADVLLKGMPFIKFKGVYKGITSLNILFYEAIGFILIFVFLLSILGLLLKVTGILQKIIDYSIVLTLPSKILGIIAGLINAIIVIFIMLFVLLNINSTRKYVYDSKVATFVLQRTFILSDATSEYYLSAEEINDTINQCKSADESKKCNANVTNILIKYDIISKEKVIELIDSNKLKNINKEDIL